MTGLVVFQALSQKNTQLQREVRRLQDILEQKEQELLELKKQGEDDVKLRQDYEVLLEQSQTLRNAMDTLRDTLGQHLAQDQNEDVMQAAIVLQKERDSLRTERDTLTSAIRALETRLEATEKDNESLQTQLQSLTAQSPSEETISTLSSENAKLRQETEQLRKSFAKLEIANEKSMTSLKSENKALRDSVQNYEAKLVASLSKLSPAFKDCRQLEDVIKVLDSKKTGVLVGENGNSEGSQTLAFLQQELGRLSVENQSLRDQIIQLQNKSHQAQPSDSSDNEVSSLRQQLIQLQNKMSVSTKFTLVPIYDRNFGLSYGNILVELVTSRAMPLCYWH